MRAHEIKLRSDGHNAGWVDMLVAHVVVPLNVIEVHRFCDPRHLVEVSEIFREVRIIFDATNIALEMPVVHRVEADQGREQAPIGLGKVGTQQVARLRSSRSSSASSA